jgi:hypothetical protein
VPLPQPIRQPKRDGPAGELVPPLQPRLAGAPGGPTKRSLCLSPACPRSYTHGMRTGLAKAGWITLIVLNTGMLLNHLVAIFVVATTADEGRMFIAYAVVNALALLVLVFAYRDRQRWAWASIWLVVLATAVTIAYGVDTIGLIYLAVAGVMALAQLATAREFFSSAHA